MTLHRWQDTGALDDNELFDLYDDAPPSYVRAGFVASADGSVAHGGSSRPLSGPADLSAFRVLRSVADAVLVGAGTARSEDYGPVRLREPARAWRQAHGRTGAPVLAVVSASARLDPRARLFGGDGPRPTVLTCAAADPDRRAALDRVADVVVAGDERVDLAAALGALAERGLTRVLCEGGPTLVGGLVSAGRLTELCLTVSPLLAGAGPALLPAALDVPVPLRLRLRHVLHADGMLMLRYTMA